MDGSARFFTFSILDLAGAGCTAVLAFLAAGAGLESDLAAATFAMISARFAAVLGESLDGSARFFTFSILDLAGVARAEGAMTLTLESCRPRDPEALLPFCSACAAASLASISARLAATSGVSLDGSARFFTHCALTCSPGISNLAAALLIHTLRCWGADQE